MFYRREFRFFFFSKLKIYKKRYLNKRLTFVNIEFVLIFLNVYFETHRFR